MQKQQTERVIYFANILQSNKSLRNNLCLNFLNTVQNSKVDHNADEYVSRFKNI